MKLRAALVALLLLVAGSSANALITLNRLEPAGTGPINLAVNQEVTIRFNIRNAEPSSEIFGLGFSARGYNEAVADFVSGRAVRRYLQDFDDAFLPNLAGTAVGVGTAQQRALAENAIGANGNRVQLALSAATVPQVGNIPSTDPGLDNVVGTAQFEITFRAGATPGTSTTIFFDTGYQGDLVNLAGGATEEGVGFSVVINVPEPSALSASGAALASVLGVVAIRRRL